jgi:2-hydroxychromene-2-carboxylate isomerase
MREPAIREQSTDLLLNSCWGQGRDISSSEELQSILCPLLKSNFPQALSTANSIEIKELLRNNTSEAIGAGIFGVPSMVVDEEIFWGSDRVTHLFEYLHGNLQIDRGRFEKMISVPRGSDRKGIKLC